MEKLKEYAKQSVLVLMLGLALFMGFTVGYHYNKIVKDPPQYLSASCCKLREGRYTHMHWK
jgi:hypothetical protein